jgi:hypothetical protein
MPKNSFFKRPYWKKIWPGLRTIYSSPGFARIAYIFLVPPLPGLGAILAPLALNYFLALNFRLVVFFLGNSG